MAKIIRTDGTEKEIGDHEISLQEAKDAVGGYIDIVYLPGGEDVLVIHEEGRVLGLPVNKKATELFGSTIVGNVILAKASQV